MQLIPATNATDADLRFMVRGVEVIKLFYVSTGRNAWWTTWIFRYSPGCMHTTMESAKAFCETNRAQGTVFYVRELPAIACIVPERALVLTEINTPEILGRFDLNGLIGIAQILPISTMTLRQVLHIFRPESALWSPNYPKKDSAVISYCSNVDALERVGPEVSFADWESRSVGPKYYLKWSSRPTEIKAERIRAVASAMKARLT